MRIQRPIRILIIALTLGVLAEVPTADARDLTTCAQWDSQLVNLVETLGENQTIVGEKLAAATQTMMRARKACRQGRFDEALALYSSVNAELAVAQLH